MFVLHVDLKVRSGSSKALENTYGDIFRPAISSQPGFDRVLLLQSSTDQSEYRLVIAFQDEPSQKKWVATKLHQDVWPRMEKNCSSYKAETFLPV
jgi:heme-degrading monooxygenase HmoA